jgi:hypothetical protein
MTTSSCPFSGGKDSLSLRASRPRAAGGSREGEDRSSSGTQAVDGRPASTRASLTGLVRRATARTSPGPWASDQVPVAGRRIRAGRSTNRMHRRRRSGSSSQTASIGQAGGTGGAQTRASCFSAAVADLRTRWCSAILKIDVANSAINNESALQEREDIYETHGERRQESNNTQPAMPRSRSTSRPRSLVGSISGARSSTGPKSASGKSSNVGGSDLIRPTTWDGAASRACSASSGIQTSGRVRTQ